LPPNIRFRKIEIVVIMVSMVANEIGNVRTAADGEGRPGAVPGSEAAFGLVKGAAEARSVRVGDNPLKSLYSRKRADLEFLPPCLEFFPPGLEFLRPGLDFLPSGLETLPCSQEGRPPDGPGCRGAADRRSLRVGQAAAGGLEMAPQPFEIKRIAPEIR